jgi:hypothetical protein
MEEGMRLGDRSSRFHASWHEGLAWEERKKQAIRNCRCIDTIPCGEKAERGMRDIRESIDQFQLCSSCSRTNSYKHIFFQLRYS